jgi:hypothetical protein
MYPWLTPTLVAAASFEAAGLYTGCLSDVATCVRLQLEAQTLTGTLPTDIGRLVFLADLCAAPAIRD